MNPENYDEIYVHANDLHQCVTWYVKFKELGILKVLLGQGPINSKFSFLKSLQEREERIFEYNLLHSMMVYGKKVFLKRLLSAVM